MTTSNSKAMPIESSADVVRVRQAVRQMAVDRKFSLVEQTKIVTAASEIARNTLEYGGGGTATLETAQQGSQQGLRLTFEDEGPGIPDLDLALQDGFTTGDGLGIGLGGAKRLVDDFAIESAAGKGTKVTIVRWK